MRSSSTRARFCMTRVTRRFAGILLSIYRQGRFQQALELGSILTGDGDTCGQGDVGPGQPALQLDRLGEVFAGAGAAAAQFVGQAVERHEQFVQCAFAPLLVEGQRAFRQHPDGRQVDRQVGPIDAQGDGRTPRRGRPIEERTSAALALRPRCRGSAATPRSSCRTGRSSPGSGSRGGEG